MADNIAKFITAITKAKAVREEYRQYILGGDNNKVSIKDLTWVIGNMYDLQIEMYEVADTGNFIRGLMERYSNRVRILVREKLNLSLKRYVAVKELCHVVVDETEDWSPTGDETIRRMVAEYQSQPDNIQGFSVGTISETYAHFAAVEILYPFEHRAIDKETLKTGETNLAEIAAHYEIPTFAVEQAHRDAHMRAVGSVYALLSAREKISK